VTISHACEACGAAVRGADMEGFAGAYLTHARSAHPDWPYPDMAIRNYAEATQRLTGSTERLETMGDVDVRPVTEDRIDDWLSFFDHDAFAGNPPWAACYCTEPHLLVPGTPPEDVPEMHWSESRATMVELLRSGRSFGYLAYVDGRAGGWVNASRRSEYALYRLGAGSEPADGDVVGVSCFIIAPPYRRHGLAGRLLARVLEDAPGRGVAWVEAYPAKGGREDDAGNFRGPRSMYEANGFLPAEDAKGHTVMRRRV